MPEHMKARITAVKPSFLQKCISFNEKFYDAYEPRLFTNFSVFVPKLSPKFITPVVMINISNGNSSVLIRVESPLILKQKLEKIIGLLDTALFSERWERITNHSDLLMSQGCLAAYDPLYFQK